MKSYLILIVLLLSIFSFSQDNNDKTKIEATLNNYIDGFYLGDTLKLKAALKPRLYKFGYLKNTNTKTYKYYEHLSYSNALKMAHNIKLSGNIRTDTIMRSVKVFEITDHIAAAKVTAAWGLDYILLSKDNGNWMIEEVIWQGPFEHYYKKKTTTTTYYLIRHAEKDRSHKHNKDPHLIAKGRERAKNWASILKEVPFDIIYTTGYNRTIETAEPTAKAHNLNLTYYNPSELNFDNFLETTKGKSVLIVGHSNTIPMFVNKLIDEKKYDQISEDNNSNLYIVTVTEKDKTATLLKID